MALQLLHEETNLVNNIVHFRQPMQLKGLVIHITGTNGATPVAIADIGKIILKNRKDEIVNCQADSVLSYNHQVGGNPLDNSTGSGALEMFLYIPFGYDDKNVLTMLPKDQYQLTLDHNSELATRIASGGKVRVYADVSYGVSAYTPIMRQYAFSANASGKILETVRTQNIYAIMISDIVSSVQTLVGSNISTVQLNVGDFDSRLDLDAVIAMSNYKMKVESDYNLSAMAYISDGDITQRFSDSADIYIDVGSGGSVTVQILMLGALFDSERALATQNAQIDRLQTIKNNKIDVKDFKTSEAISLLNIS